MASNAGPLRAATVEGGQLAGAIGGDEGVAVFRGIPFAAPPVGALRWRAPQPAPRWSGVRQADRFGPICPQHQPPEGSFYHREFYLTPEAQSEDCLYLNVWTAAASAGERRPVMVWFHGGGFTEGSGSLESFHGEALARKGAVLVTANYRLNVFGYMAHPELSAESPEGVSGNYGLLDQVEALRWVRRNIAAFGGDPERVTVFGQSAGSMSVFALCASPLAEGLFAQAIGQSGSQFSFREIATLQDAEQLGAQLGEARGARTLAELRALPAAELLGPPQRGFGGPRMGLCVDGHALPESPARVIAEGRGHARRLIVGATSDEWTPMMAGQTVTPAQLREGAARFGARAEEFLRLYPAATDAEAWRAQVASGSAQMLAGMQAWARAQSRRAPGSAFLYRFERAAPGWDSETYGAFHSGELYYVFGTLGATARPWEDVDRRVADAVTSYWANFAATGDPNGPGLPEWPAYAEPGARLLRIGERTGAAEAPPELEFFGREIEEWVAAR